MSSWSSGDSIGTLMPALVQRVLREQARAIQLLIERVDYDGGRGKVSVAFRPTGIKALAKERAAQPAGGAA